MNSVNEAKKHAAQIIADAVKSRTDEILNSEEFREELDNLRKELIDFENNPDSKKYFQCLNECGLLESRLDIKLGRLGEEDNETVFEVLQALNELPSYIQDQYSRGNDEWTAVICLGDVVSFDPTPKRNCYSIHSDELNLKIMRVTDEEHGLALIEQSMRESGVYPSIVHIDRYGSLVKYWDLSEVSNLSDEQLQELISTKEEE